eukprot:TRINITY_DN9520_c0_g1_i1.p1 TRINITY_DN9520_c0_g1~~TRINITY_DN9520_c0_g1_i1.p1  ORF type:complete len:928 (-),score=91.49 TRINITY_DN9520_c0_g1_i1:308-3043(-)
MATSGQADDNIMHIALAWVFAALAVVLFGVFLHFSFLLARPGRVANRVRSDYAVALRSALVYMAVAVLPLVFPCPLEEGQLTAQSWGSCKRSPYWFLPTNFMHVYHWLPLWYAIMVTTRLGPFLSIGCRGIFGALIALFACSFMNFVVPGGAGLLARDPSAVSQAWLPGGYSAPAALVYAVIVAYAVYFSNTSTDTKAFCLCVFSAMLVNFMNPETDKGFRTVLCDLEFGCNWNGPVMCDVWLIIFAVVLSAFSLGYIPYSRRSCEHHTCVGTAAVALVDLANDTNRCMKWLLVNFHEDNFSFDVESSFFYIKQLGERRTEIEGLLSKAPWECYTNRSRMQLLVLKTFTEMLRHVRQILRVELEHLRFLGSSRSTEHSGVAKLLDAFVSAFGEVISAFALASRERCGLTQQARDMARQSASQADAALVAALEHLKTTNHKDDTTLASKMAFVDRLRTWPPLVQRCVSDLEGDAVGVAVRSGMFSGSDPHPSGPSLRDRHWYAMRNLTSWMLALLWSLYRRNYSALCVSTVSVLISVSSGSGSSFDRNINRMLGAGLGLTVGNAPALLVLQGFAENDKSPFFLPCFIIYCVLMFVMWVMAIYGYLAKNSKYSYACVIWAAFGSAHMVRHIPVFNPKHGLFLEVMDNFVACLIVFLVDLLWTHYSGSGTSRQAKAAVIRCISDTAAMVDKLRDGNIDDVHIEAFQDHIKRARHLDGEMRQEGFVWTALLEPPYNSSLVHALLDACDGAYVAAFALHASAKRLVAKGLACKILSDELDEDVSKCCHMYVQATREELRGNLDAESLCGLSGELSGMNSRLCKERPQTSLPSLSPVEEGAAFGVRLSAQALRGSLRRIGGLLVTHDGFTNGSYQVAITQPPSSFASDTLASDPPTQESSQRSAQALSGEVRRRRSS